MNLVQSGNTHLASSGIIFYHMTSSALTNSLGFENIVDFFPLDT